MSADKETGLYTHPRCIFNYCPHPTECRDAIVVVDGKEVKGCLSPSQGEHVELDPPPDDAA